jgi:sugar O-acyltransferase (sialic acid O-acetyltransferase NeuD family)
MNIVVVGSSGHAKVVIDIIEKEGLHCIIGLIDAYREVGAETLGYRVLGGELDLPRLVEEHDLSGLVVAIGDNHVRGRVTELIAARCPYLTFITAVHPQASVARAVKLGGGTVVMAGAVINSSCEIGPGCLINTRASLDHDSVMAPFSSLAPGAVTGGGCHIGTYSAVGMGALLLHRLHIGDHSVIGAGAVVTRSVGNLCVSYGTPARTIRQREPGEKYL